MKTLQLMEVMLPETWSGNEWVFTLNAEDDGAVVPDEDFQEYLDRYSRRPNQRWCLGEYYFCEHCHTVHKRCDMVQVKYDYGEDDYYFLCEACFADAWDDNEVTRCEDCGVAWETDEHMYYLDNLDRCVCGVCQENYSQCCYCHKWFPTEDMTYINDREEYACRDCGGDGCYGYCDECNEAYDGESLHYTDDNCYCDSCWDQRKNDYRCGVVEYYACHDQDNQLDPLILPDESKYGTRCCGFELEYHHPDGDDSAQELFDRFDDAGFIGVVKVTEDGTVDGEVVTAPVSINWLYQDDCPLEKVTKMMTDFGCTAWKEQLVGGHIHVGCSGMSYSDKVFLVRLVNACQSFFRVISGRTNAEGALDYCRFGRANSVGMYDSTHGCAVNIQTKYPTVEFRFWGGTLNFQSLRTRAVLCTYLMEYCVEWENTHNWEEEFPRWDGESDDMPGWYEQRSYLVKYYGILLGFLKSLCCKEHGQEVLDYCAVRVRRDREKWFCDLESDVVFQYLKSFGKQGA